MNEDNKQSESHLIQDSRSYISELHSVIGSIARDLDGGLPSGDIATLRKLRQDDPSCPAFWKICTARLSNVLQIESNRIEAERRWAVILRAMAELAGYHSSNARLGTALAEANVAEARVVRLLRAHGGLLEECLRHVAHQLRSRAIRCDQSEIATLILSDGNKDWAERIRRRIARDFYGASRKSEV